MRLCIESLSDDERGSSKLEMKALLDETFVKNRTSNCEFHLEQSVKNGVISIFLPAIVLYYPVRGQYRYSRYLRDVIG